MERRHLLEVLYDRAKSRSTILTSQFVTASWHDLIGSPTLADAIMERIRLQQSRDCTPTMRPIKKAGATSKDHPKEEKA